MEKGEEGGYGGRWKYNTLDDLDRERAPIIIPISIQPNLHL